MSPHPLGIVPTPYALLPRHSLIRQLRLERNLLAERACRAVRWGLLVLCPWPLGSPASAQGFSHAPDQAESFQNVQVVKGLLHYTVIGIAQDHRGYIWLIGTDRLFRYDGYQLQCPSDSTRETLLERWKYRGLAGGAHGVLCLFGSGDEVVLYDIDRTSARVYRLPTEQSTLTMSLHATTVIEDSRGRFVIGTNEGYVYRINPQTAEITTLNPRSGSLDPPAFGPIAALAEDSSGDIWAGGDMGIVCVTSEEGGPRSRGSSRPPRGALPPESAVRMTPAANGKIWVATAGGEFGLFDPATGVFTSAGRVNNAGHTREVRALVEDPSGNVWIGTREGLDQWRPGERDVRSYLRGKDRPPVSATSVRVLFVDRSGLLWIGTWSQGLFTYAPWRHKFQSCTPSGGDRTGLSGPFVTAVREDRDGTLWVGTVGDDLNYLVRGSGKFRQLRHIPGDASSLSSDEITCICERRNGDLWVGTIEGGISRLGHQATSPQRMRHNPQDPGSLGANTVNAIYEDTDGTVWVGHVRGVDRYEDRTGKFSPFIRWPQETVGLTGTAGYFYRDRSGNLWIATAGRGLLRIGTTPGDSVWYRREPGRTGTLPSNSVDCLREDELGRLWLGTSAGLSRFDQSAGVFHTYALLPPTGEVSPLSAFTRTVSTSVEVVGIAPDSKGNLWLSTSSGLLQFDIPAGVVRTFGRANGMVVKEGMRHAMFTTVARMDLLWGHRGAPLVPSG